MSQCTVARLSSKELHELTVLLCAERERVAKRRDALRADMSAAMESIDASDLFDAAPSDPDRSERTTSLLLMAEAEIRLEEIERAFARIEREPTACAMHAVRRSHTPASWRYPPRRTA